MYKEQFASRLKKAREKTGLTQRDVAKEASISQPSLAHYETGAREPSIETLGTLAELYGVSTDWLLGIVNNKNNESINHNKYMKDMEKSIQQEKRIEKRLAT